MRHGVARISRQIQHDLLQLSAIHPGPARIRIHDQFEGDVLAKHAAQNAVHVFEDGINLQDRRLKNLIPAIGQELAREPRSALRCFSDFFDPHSGALTRLVSFQQEFAVAQNHG